MFGLSTALIIRDKLAIVKRFSSADVSSVSPSADLFFGFALARA